MDTTLATVMRVQCTDINRSRHLRRNFNNPGPQLSVPQPGNAVDQLSPLIGAGQPDALGIK
jgi:hypothetical protein